MGNRKKAADDPSRRAPGPTGWVVGTKRVFFDRHREEFRTTNDRGAFYDKMTTGFMMKYGAGFDLSTDLEDDVPDPDFDDMTEDYSDLNEEEIKATMAYRKRLRDKIGQHYRNEGSKIIAPNPTSDVSRLFMDHAQAQALQQAVPVQVIQYYSKLYYAVRVRPTFDIEFQREMNKAAAQLRQWDEQGVDPPHGWSRPKQLPVRNRVTAECWHRETQSFKDSVTLAHQEERARQKAAFESAMSTPSQPSTPEEFQHAIATAGLYLQPIMDACNTNVKLCASVFLYGPMPEDGGKLGVLSAHAGTTRGLNALTLAEFDPDGLLEIEGVLTHFAKNCYADDERLARALPSSRTRGGPARLTSSTSPPQLPSTAPHPTRESSPPRQALTRLRRAGEAIAEPRVAPTTAAATSDAIHEEMRQQESGATPDEMHEEMDVVSDEAREETRAHTNAVPNNRGEEAGATLDMVHEEDAGTNSDVAPNEMREMREEDVGTNSDVAPNEMHEEDAGISLDARCEDEVGAPLDEMHEEDAGISLDERCEDEAGAPLDEMRKEDAGISLDERCEDEAGMSLDEMTTASLSTTPMVTVDIMTDMMLDTMGEVTPYAAYGTPTETMPGIEATSVSSGVSSGTYRVTSAASPHPVSAARLELLPAQPLLESSLPTPTPRSISPPSGEELALPLPAVDRTDVEQGRHADIWKSTMPAGCPTHITGVLAACLRGQEWGLEFARAVGAYVALERALGFPILNHGRLVLSGSIRPVVYREWVIEKREYGGMVDIGEPSEFGTKWRMWWEAMQPPLRISPAGDLLAVDVVSDEVTHLAQWGDLEKCCGRDGLVQFLLTLVWWGDVVNAADRRTSYPAHRLEWELAVQDFREVLEAMMAAPDFKRVAKKRAAGSDYTITMLTKHARDDSDKEPTPSKRARIPLLERTSAKGAKATRAKGPHPAKDDRPAKLAVPPRRKSANNSQTPNVVPRVSTRVRKPSQGARRGQD